MAEEIKQQDIAVDKLILQNSGDVRSVYTNFARCQITSLDIRLFFSEIIVGQQVGKPATEMGVRQELRAEIVMSPVLLKAVAKLLTEQMAIYEKIHGKIEQSKPAKEIAPAAKK
jgi:hypothetical protein